ncbi:Autolysin [Slackia heliotrinireducens]|uniref:CHAP domain-containing protein n=1 Tax=Slackia heliotrinireducens (strain ATCC 29202 / DSM 20476 / NCTC 11029 / RHS 1) TaxID=471855 RepID=C7N0M8_SLAHD|nr:CHAP domain-containing protein [Slackia heliotrinireducens]ACV21106.1 CHAP domain-containing protein [Slackia heliotrinireducens DSM 20476]VEH03610.1 Autolysin [Slackia heliotrinireducens]
MRKHLMILMAALAVVAAMGLLPATALAVDDYPADLKSAAKDTKLDPWRFYNRNCTSFVAWRLNHNNGIDFDCFYECPDGLKWENANSWALVARQLGYKVDSTPAPGAIAWWNTGSYGHVAWVESVDGDQVTIEEYNYDRDGHYHRRTLNASKVEAFIHLADLPDDIGWVKESGLWYYLDKEGTPKTGWQKVARKWYYLDADGVMLRGWQKIGGSWYYLTSSGAMKTGWLKDNGKWYYLQSSGRMAKGWVKVGSYWYYCNGSGVMQTGWQKIGGSWYYLYESGRMASNCYVDGYWLTSSGRMV